MLVPPVLLNTTVNPPEVIALPAASRGLNLTIVVDPLDTVDDKVATVDWLSEGAPGVTASNWVLLTPPPFKVALIVVAVPALIPVKLAE